jgi:FlaA1/EpsC-like NDP-sugar epimerase
VLQAATLTEGGDVFLLDMGEPVRIKALAEQIDGPAERVVAAGCIQSRR